jgi:hypothetical protein
LNAPVARTVDRLSYYIHDNSDTFRLEMRGSLTGDHIAELEGCWKTAKPSVAGRRVLIDLRAVRVADAAGRSWLAEMARVENTEFVASPELSGDLQAIGSRIVKPRAHSSGTCARIKSIFGGSGSRFKGRSTSAKSKPEMPSSTQPDAPVR